VVAGRDVVGAAVAVDVVEGDGDEVVAAGGMVAAIEPGTDPEPPPCGGGAVAPDPRGAVVAAGPASVEASLPQLTAAITRTAATPIAPRIDAREAGRVVAGMARVSRVATATTDQA
jgi:hypothetical protein